MTYTTKRMITEEHTIWIQLRKRTGKSLIRYCQNTQFKTSNSLTVSSRGEIKCFPNIQFLVVLQDSSKKKKKKKKV